MVSPLIMNMQEKNPQNTNQIEALIETVKTLRSPNGCPWDKEQTHQSLRQYLIEEAYETLEALDMNDPKLLKDEMGDLLLQIMLHSQIASENAHFTIYDVAQAINEKLIRRHPHVFGDTKVKDSKEVLINWEQIKKKKEGKQSVIAGVPKNLPSLQRAARITEKAARVGFDWDKIEDVIAKVEEELAEVKQAIKENNKKEISKEIGDLLFSVSNLARKFELNPEDCHRETIEKFINRFNYIESHYRDNKLEMENATLTELDALWNEAKKKGL